MATKMPQITLLIRQKTKPGKRDEARRIWEKHMQPAVSANPEQTAYYYCFDNADPDMIRVFQQYSSPEAAQTFLKTEAYQAYIRELRPLLSAPPMVRVMTPVWVKGA